MGRGPLGVRLAPAKSPGSVAIGPRHPRGSVGPLLPSVLDLRFPPISGAQPPGGYGGISRSRAATATPTVVADSQGTLGMSLGWWVLLVWAQAARTCRYRAVSGMVSGWYSTRVRRAGNWDEDPRHTQPGDGSDVGLFSIFWQPQRPPMATKGERGDVPAPWGAWLAFGVAMVCSGGLPAVVWAGHC